MQSDYLNTENFVVFNFNYRYITVCIYCENNFVNNMVGRV